MLLLRAATSWRVHAWSLLADSRLVSTDGPICATTRCCWVFPRIRLATTTGCGRTRVGDELQHRNYRRVNGTGSISANNALTCDVWATLRCNITGSGPLSPMRSHRADRGRPGRWSSPPRPCVAPQAARKHHPTDWPLCEGRGQPCELRSFGLGHCGYSRDIATGLPTPSGATATSRAYAGAHAGETMTGMPFSTDVPDRGSIASSSESTLELTPARSAATRIRVPGWP